MNYNFFFVAVFVSLASCKSGKKIPDVSKVDVKLSTQHFERDFFTLDTLNIDAGMQKIYEKYPAFSVDFMQNILGVAPQPDTMIQMIKLFSKDYSSVYKETEKKFQDFSVEENEIKKGFQFVKYYFPNYNLPNKLVTYLGPWDARFMLSDNTSISGVFRDADMIGIGLQLSLGKDFPVYKQEQFQQLYPNFINRRFEREYIPVNVLSVIIDDLYADKNLGKPLVEQMIEAGKRMYLLDAFLPNVADTLKIGYTKAQLDGCYKNEANIWSFFITNDFVFVTEPAITKDYMTDAPNTAVLGDASPGFIGKFIGWQIVKKWMSNNEKTSLEQLLKTPAKQIFQESKYKP